jgi:hypothetical protein
VNRKCPEAATGDLRALHPPQGGIGVTSPMPHTRDRRTPHEDAPAAQPTTIDRVLSLVAEQEATDEVEPGRTEPSPVVARFQSAM